MFPIPTPNYHALAVHQIELIHGGLETFYRCATYLYEEYHYHCIAYALFVLRYIVPLFIGYFFKAGQYLSSFQFVQNVCAFLAICGVVSFGFYCRAISSSILAKARRLALSYLEATQSSKLVTVDESYDCKF